MLKHLIIKSLHRDESFLAKASARLEKFLENKGVEVAVRDLYSMKFNPVLTAYDFQLMQSGELPDEIKTEQQYIDMADLVWIIYPIWWAGMPAILKGYIDRIFLSGFAYKMAGDKPMGLLNGKKVIIVNSMGESYESYSDNGMFDALHLTTDTGIFRFCGMQVVEHLYFTSIMSADKDERERYMNKLLGVAEYIYKNQFNNN